MLAPPVSGRWSARIKAAVVDCIRSGELSADEAVARFDLSAEELQTWLDRAERFGLRGLKVTTLQELRA